MNATSRKARAQLRAMRRETVATHRETRTARRARRAVASGLATAKQHMIVAGIPVPLAERFASAFSRGMVAQGTVTVSVRPGGRLVLRRKAKLYSVATAAARLATYRPKDKAAAAVFERVAA